MKLTLLPKIGMLLLVIVLSGCGSNQAGSEAQSGPESAGALTNLNNAAEGRRIRRVVDRTIHATMAENRVPGMAVGVSVGGKRYFYSYGVASKASGRRVSRSTIFEIGSVSKTFTATMAAYARERGRLSLEDSASKHLPALSKTSFDDISLLNLATYTAGGLPLQFPDDVTNESRMLRYFQQWQPVFPVGTRRLYSNPSVGLFGHLAASSMGWPFTKLMQRQIFPMLGLENTYIHVPRHRMRDYAFGYTAEEEPVRVSPGLLDSETYGVKSTAPDLIRFAEEQMGLHGVDPRLRRAILTTHAGYYRVHNMTQGLGWEMYRYPVDLAGLQEGNSPAMLLEANKAVALRPPLSPRRDFLANKTGSTDGFGAYVAFLPSEHKAVVLLANKNYPIPARVRAAYRILTALDGVGSTL